MRIWYLNHFASTPDQQATGAYFLMEGLANRGHEITIFASGFNYYLRNDQKMMGHWLRHKQQVEKLCFLWLRTWPTQGRLITRLLNMITYAALALYAGLCQRPKPDVIIGTCPHPLAGLVGWILAKHYRAQFVYEIRDIWPESMTQGNHISEKNILMRAMMQLQLFLYRKSNLIISVIPKLNEYLLSKSITQFHFLWLPNGVRIQRDLLPAPSGGPTTAAQRFKLFYFGGHSKHQALDTLLDAALLLQKEPASPFKIVMVGEGTEKPRLMARATSLGLANLEFRPAVPRSEVLKIAQEADCFIAHAFPLSVLQFGNGLNKLCDFMLSARPIINASGAGNDPVTDNQCGLGVPAMSPEAIVTALKHIYALTPEERYAMGARAQAYAVQQFDAAILAQKLENALQTIQAKVN